jgi:hypothetical protein
MENVEMQLNENYLARLEANTERRVEIINDIAERTETDPLVVALAACRLGFEVFDVGCEIAGK